MKPWNQRSKTKISFLFSFPDTCQHHLHISPSVIIVNIGRSTGRGLWRLQYSRATRNTNDPELSAGTPAQGIPQQQRSCHGSCPTRAAGSSICVTVLRSQRAAGSAKILLLSPHCCNDSLLSWMRDICLKPLLLGNQRRTKNWIQKAAHI